MTQNNEREAVAKVLFRQDEDGLEPISFYSIDEYPKEELKDRFVMMDVYLSPQQPQSVADASAEHDNDVIERIALALENAEGEFKTLPEYVALVRGMKNE